MIFVYLLFIVSISISVFLLRKKWNPGILFTMFWLVLTFLSNLKLYKLGSVNTNTYLLVSLGVFSFTIGCLVIKMANTKTNELCFQKTKINKPFLKIVSVIVIALLSIYLARVVRIVAQGNGLDYVRMNFYDLVLINQTGRFIWQLGLMPLAVALIPINVYAFCLNKNRYVYLIFSILLTLFLSICEGGRIYILYFLIFLVYFVTSSTSKPRFSNKVKKTIAIAIAVVGCFFALLMIANSRNVGTSPFESFYLYFAGCFDFFDLKIAEVDLLSHAHGISFFFAPISVLLLPLKTVGIIGYPESYINVSNVISNLQTYVQIGDGYYYNAFSTCFFYFYYDFGVFGVAVESFIFGMISFWIYQKSFKDEKFKVLYSIFLVAIFTSMIRWQFGRIEFFLTLIYILLFFKKEVKYGFFRK